MNTKTYIITVVSWILFIIFSLFGIMYANIKIYNNGVCTKCGGHYEYNEAVGHRQGSTYVYKCDNCNNVIEICYTP